MEVLGVSRLPDEHYAVFRSLTRFCWVDREEAYKALGISVHNPRGGFGGKQRRRSCLPDAFRNVIRGDQNLLRLNPEMGPETWHPARSAD